MTLSFCSGVFTIWGLYPTNIETDDPVKCNGPAFNPASVPEGVLQQMQCIFMNNAGGARWLECAD